MTELSYDQLTPAHLDCLSMTAAHPPERPEDCRFILDDDNELIGFRVPQMFSHGVPMKWDTAIVSLETGLPIPMVDAADIQPPKKKRSAKVTADTAAAPEPSAPAASSAICWLAHGEIAPSALNPRTHFDPAKIADLKTSFAAHGFTAALSHLLVRPIRYRWKKAEITNGMEIEMQCGKGAWRWLDSDLRSKLPKDSAHRYLLTEDDCEWALREHWPKWELICGERRWRAAGELGITPVPAVVEELSDQEVLELQLVENLQREDLNPIEEAEGVCRLLDLRDDAGAPIYTTQSLAERLGKSLMHLSRCRSLRRLRGTSAGEALETGELTPKHGELLARIPSGAIRDELTKRVLKPADGFAPMPTRQLERIIRDEVMVELKGADFDLNDETLVPMQHDEHGDRVKGGACADCPFNTKNAEGEKPGKFHMCMNPECFREKKAAKYERWRAEVESAGKGRTTLTSEEVAKAFDYSGKRLAFNSGFVKLDDLPPEYELKQGVKNTDSWKKLIRGQGVPVVLLPDKDGMIHEVVKRELAVQAATDAGHKIFKEAEKERRRENDDEAAARSLAEQQQRELDYRLRSGRIAAVVEKAAGAKKIPDGFYDLGIALLLESTEGRENLHEVALRRGLPEIEVTNEDAMREWVEQRLAKMAAPELFGFFVEMLVMQTYAEPRTEAVKRMAKLFGADLKAADAKVRAEVKAELAKRAEEAEIATALKWSGEREDIESFEWEGAHPKSADVCEIALPKGVKGRAAVLVARNANGWHVGWQISGLGKKVDLCERPEQTSVNYDNRTLALRAGLLTLAEHYGLFAAKDQAAVKGRIEAVLATIEAPKPKAKKKGPKTARGGATS
jgi:ParB/RepB/Spo0J family partition protein